MTKKKTIEKTTEGKKVFVDSFHIHWASDHTINKDTQSILDSLTRLSLTKAYYQLFQADH